MADLDNTPAVDEEDEGAYVTIEFEDGEKVDCEGLFIFEVEGKEYVALAPVDLDSDDVYLYEYRDLEGGEYEFLDIEDDALFERVVAEFERIDAEMAEEIDAAEEEE